MTLEEAAEIIARLNAFLLGRLPLETQRAWCSEMQLYGVDEAREGVREYARRPASAHPNLGDVVACILEARERRAARARQDLNRPALPTVASDDPGREARQNAARKNARDILANVEKAMFGRSRKARLIPEADGSRRPNGHLEMSAEAVSTRQRELQEQAERLLKEEQEAKEQEAKEQAARRAAVFAERDPTEVPRPSRAQRPAKPQVASRTDNDESAEAP